MSFCLFFSYYFLKCRESRAIDTESLCVLSGKAVWSLRIDICVLDNGG